MAQAGHTGEAQVTVAPAQHPVPGAPGCSGARGHGNRVRSLPAHQRQGRSAFDPPAAAGRRRTPPDRVCPGNALQAPATDAGDAGFAQLQTRTHAESASIACLGVTDTRRSLRILAEYPSETAQFTGHRAADLAERGEAVPGSAFARCPLGFAQRTRFQRYRKRLVWPSPSVSSMCSAVHPIMRESPCLAPGSTT